MVNAEPSQKSSAEGALPPASLRDRDRLLTDLLRRVSRSFYLTLRVLPKEVRKPIGLAYLLARAADTIADTRALPPAERLEHLLTFRVLVEGPAAPEKLKAIGRALREKQSSADERELLSSLPTAFSLLEATPEPGRTLVQSVVVTLTQGMEIDLTTFPAEESGQIAALKDAGALDHYIYYVAGCVGGFWTRITMAHTSALNGWDAEKMSETGVRFGKALQLTNVLRDIPKDLRIGRCYLPAPELASVDLSPEDLLDPINGPKARPVLAAWIHTALKHYGDAGEYLLAIPRRCVRLRLGALWPILIGLATLGKLARNPDWLDPEKPSKVNRGWVYRMMALSVPAVLSNGILRGWVGRLRRAVETAL